MDREFKRQANIKHILLIFMVMSGLAIALLYFLPIPTRAGGEKLTSGEITFTDGSGNPLNGKIEINGAGISGNHKENVSYVSWKNLPHVIISYNVLKTPSLSVNMSISKDSPKASVKLDNYGRHMPAMVNITPPGTPLKYVEINAAGVFFTDAEISIQYTDAEVIGQDVDKLTIYSFDIANSKWTRLPTKIDTTKKIASTKVKSLSVFALSGLENSTIQIHDTNNTPFVSDVKIYDEAKKLKKEEKTNFISPADIPARGELEIDALPSKQVAVKFKLKKVDKGEIILDDFGKKNPVLEAPSEPVIKYIDISAKNLGFDSVEVRIHYTDKDLGNADENTLVISHWNGVSWDILPTTVDAANNTVTAITTSLSPFAVYPFTSSLDAWSYAGNSIPAPTNASWVQATSADKSAVASLDSNRWETKLTTNHNQTDYQMYRFYISEPAREITNLTSTWIGYGETLAGYNTYLYIWNNSNNSWKQLDTKHLVTDGTLNGSITTGITDYVNASGYVHIAAAAEHYNYAPPAPAGLSASAGQTDVTISWSPATDPDNDTVQYYAEIIGVASSGWISGTNWYYYGLGGGNYYTYRVKTRDTFASAESSFASGSFDTASPPPSCPLVYIWNGTGFEYSTDIAGASLGAQTSVISYPRYYDMPDLKANNGSYNLLVREVLPEADYFDMAKLVAADVPDGYNIYTNWLGMKSFGVGWHDDKINNIRYSYPTTPQLLTTKKSTERTPIHATNSTGSDVTAQLQKVDNNPLRETAYGMDEYILDFGKINHPEYAKLIISAWVNYIPGRDARLPITLSVINKTGQWEQAAELGSFTGDLETRLYNISNIWITEDHRLKLRPSYSKTMTLVIDKVMMDDSKPVDVESTIVNISNANLHYRGNDKIIHSTFDNRIHGDNVIEPDVTSDYFYGNFTKFGDVTPLLTQIDDKYAIMRHGDELSLSFDEVAEVNNKHRQYFLYALDWYVTMTAIDTNRTFIRDTVGLLPFVNMSTFPYNRSIEDYPHNAEHNQYINDWNTRICEDRVSGTCYNSTTGELVITVPETYNKFLSSYSLNNENQPAISENVLEKPMLRSLNTNYVELKLTFSPGYNVSGYVSDISSGLPLSGVLVQTNTGLNTTTNTSGFYNFSLINSTYIINASKIGYDDNATNVTVNGRDLTNVNIPLLYHPFNLSGYILNKSSGLPLSGAMVKATNTSLSTTTSADGFYNFTLIDGEHSVVAILQNYAINSTTVTINGANITNANISLIPTVPRGKDAWHSAGYNLPLPYSASWIPATLAQKNAILYNDSNIWETKLTTGHDQYDDQLYRFNVMQPANEVKNLTVKWIGHGENKADYDTYLYIWNYSDVSWELLDTKNLGVEGTLNRSINIDPGNYIDLYGFVYIAARARHYDYIPGTPSWISLAGTYADEPITCSWGPVIDLDGDIVQYSANINGYNSGWINDTSFTGTALYEGNTCNVKTRDNYTYTESSSVSAYSWMDYYYSLNTNYVELKVNNQLTGNNIFNVSSATTLSSSSITWNNDIFSDNRVYYGLNETDVNNLVNGSWSVWNNNSMNPVIRLTGLLVNTTYYYRPLTWYLGTANNSVKAMALLTAKPGIWVSPAEYMVSPAGWIASPANFRTINISAAPLDGNGRYIPDLSLEAVIYNNSGVEIGRINLTGNGPYYANFNLPDYFPDERGYVTITNYSMAGEFSVLKWSCVNCHADGERYPSNFSSATVHSRHTNTEHSMSCDSSCHNNDVSTFFVVHSESNYDMNGCNGNSCHKPVLTCNECHNDVQNSADVSNTSVLSDKYGKDVHSNKQCTDCHGNLPSINAKPNCSACHPRPGSNLTSAPGSIENKSHSNNQTVACGQCHNREHDVKALTTAANECKNCHTGITHDRGTQCIACHGSDPHTVSDGSGPGCLECHNTSSLHRFENDSLSIYYLDGANFSLSVHSNLNSNNASGYGINASCWACHGNGTKPTQHPANYKKAFDCADCHTPSGSQSGKYNAPPVYKHYPGSLFTESIVYDATDTNRTCVSCHNNSKIITRNISYGTYDAGKVMNASVSHYSVNRTQGEILMESGAVTAALPNTRSTNGTNYGCNQCHSVGGLGGIYGTDYGNARGVPLSHNLMGTTGISCQSACHNSNPAANVTLHNSNVGIYPDGCYTPGCHAPPTNRRGR